MMVAVCHAVASSHQHTNTWETAWKIGKYLRLMKYLVTFGTRLSVSSEESFHRRRRMFFFFFSDRLSSLRKRGNIGYI